MAGIFLFIIGFVTLILVLLISVGLYILNKLFGGFASMRRILSQLFGLGKKTGTWQGQNQSGASSYNSGNANSSGASEEYGDDSNDVSHTNEKIFSQNEGEYVDFEEIK